ncbi:MAG TPA: DUF4126 domain-containing protein [Longimicrobiales bacterium]
MTADLYLTGRLLAIAFASGLNLYATVAILGLASRFGWIATLPPSLRGLEDPVVIASATILFLVEFVIDKVPHVDSLWDTIHTFIRPVAAALLALAAADGTPTTLHFGIAALAGLTALAAHGTKAGLRLALNATPRRTATLAISLGEDAAAIAIAIAALASPTAALIIAGTTLALLGLFGPGLWRAFVFGIRALAARIRGFFGGARWRGLDEVPRSLRALVDPPAIGAPAPSATRASLCGPRPVGTYRNGWLIRSDDDAVFLYRSFGRARRMTLPPLRETRVRHGIWADAVEIVTDRFRCNVFVLKDGPPVELIFPDNTIASA